MNGAQLIFVSESISSTLKMYCNSSRLVARIPISGPTWISGPGSNWPVGADHVSQVMLAPLGGIAVAGVDWRI
jgi:hypothetical protein